MFSVFQETPFGTMGLEFVYFFFPYIITATIPTILSIGWKNINPNRVLTDEQFWLATCYVQVGYIRWWIGYSVRDVRLIIVGLLFDLVQHRSVKVNPVSWWWMIFC